MTKIRTKSGDAPTHEKKPRAKKGEGTPRVSKGGKSRGKRKLTNAQVLEIVARSGNGEKPSKLAKEYGVSHPSISAILKGRTYVWLTKIGAPVEITETAEMAEAA